MIMMILDQIVEEKKREVEQAKARVSQEELIKRTVALGSRRSFKEAISQPGKAGSKQMQKGPVFNSDRTFGVQNIKLPGLTYCFQH